MSGFATVSVLSAIVGPALCSASALEQIAELFAFCEVRL